MNLKLKTFDVLYLIGLVATAVFMVLEFVFGFLELSITILIFFWAMKLLSGFGLILTVSNIILWILNRFTEKFSKKDIQVLVIIQIIVPGILIGYATYTIFSSLPPSPPSTSIQYWIDLILFIYGIISLMLSLYIIPLIKEEFREAVDTGIIDRAKKGAKRIGRKVKKSYYNWRGNYAKVQIQDQMTLGEVLNIWRNRFAVYLLIPIAIGSLIFAPIAFVCIVFWLKIIVFEKSKPRLYERLLLLISIITITIIVCLSYILNLDFYTTTEPFAWTIQVFYLFGIVLSTVVFIQQFVKLRGITIKKIKKEIREGRTEENS
jgi:hypothetical protein